MSPPKPPKPKPIPPPPPVPVDRGPKAPLIGDAATTERTRRRRTGVATLRTDLAIPGSMPSSLNIPTS